MASKPARIDDETSFCDDTPLRAINTATTQYRDFVLTLSESITEDDVTKLCFLHQKELTTDRTMKPIEALHNLEKKGIFSQRKIPPLVNLMRRISRHDLAERCTTFWTEHSRPSSAPVLSSPRSVSRQSSLPNTTIHSPQPTAINSALPSVSEHWNGEQEPYFFPEDTVDDSEVSTQSNFQSANPPGAIPSTTGHPSTGFHISAESAFETRSDCQALPFPSPICSTPMQEASRESVNPELTESSPHGLTQLSKSSYLPHKRNTGIRDEVTASVSSPPVVGASGQFKSPPSATRREWESPSTAQQNSPSYLALPRRDIDMSTSPMQGCIQESEPPGACPQRTFTWKVNRSKLYGPICKHQKMKVLRNCEKFILQLPDVRKYRCPRLGLKLFPYGLEADAKSHVTLEADVYVPSRCLQQLLGTYSVQLTARVLDEKTQGHISSEKHVTIELMKLCGRIHQFVSHNSIIKSESLTLIIEASVRLIPNGVNYTTACVASPATDPATGTTSGDATAATTDGATAATTDDATAATTDSTTGDATATSSGSAADGATGSAEDLVFVDLVP